MPGSFLRTLSKHDEWRRNWKKLRRQKTRQAAAKKRDEELAQKQREMESSAEYLEWLQQQKEAEKLAEEKSKQIREEEYQKWLEREKLAQEQWVKQCKAQETALQRQQQQEEEMMNHKYLQEQKRREKEAEFEKQQKLQELWLAQLNSYLNTEDDTLPDFLTLDTSSCEKNGECCPFFTKTGACRYGEACSRSHFHPSVSRTLLIPGFYDHYGLSKVFRDEFNSDGQLEFEESEIYEHFGDFYQDVLGELRSIGNVLQLKVCCNHQPHLRGNVYVQYSSQKDAVRAFMKLQGRWYDGRQLSCRFVHIPSWKAAICGLFLKGKCPKGRLCNFLHVFRNPDGMFREADRDVDNQHHPGAVGRILAASVTHRDGFSAHSPRHSSTRSRREWRWSESPPSKSMKTREESKCDRKKSRKDRNSCTQDSLSSSSKSRSRKEKSHR